MNSLKLRDQHFYTIIGSSVLGMTTTRVILVTVVDNEWKYQRYPLVRGSRKNFLLVTDDELVFEGNDVPFTSDFEAVKKGELDHFRGDSKINLHSKLNIEEVRVFIETHNLNNFVSLDKISIQGTPVFPEFCDHLINQK